MSIMLILGRKLIFGDIGDTQRSYFLPVSEASLFRCLLPARTGGGMSIITTFSLSDPSNVK
jgi:hypothetical protein